MAEHDIDLALLERLVRSSAWREYRDRVLLVNYQGVTQALDTVQADHRYYQGLKAGLRLALEQPYVLLGLASPLVSAEAPARVPARVAERERAAAQEPAPRSLARPSYLA